MVKKKKKEIIKNFIKPLDNYKTIKTTLKCILKDKSIESELNDAIIRTNKIVILTYQFIRLYILNLYKENKDIPKINDDFVKKCFKIISKADNRGPKTKSDDITYFINKCLHYKHLLIKYT